MYHTIVGGLEVKLRMSVEELSNKKHQKKKNTDRCFLVSTVIQKFKHFLDKNYHIQPCKYLKTQIFNVSQSLNTWLPFFWVMLYLTNFNWSECVNIYIIPKINFKIKMHWEHGLKQWRVQEEKHNNNKSRNAIIQLQFCCIKYTWKQLTNE